MVSLAFAGTIVVSLARICVGDDSYYHSLFATHVLTKSNHRITVQVDTAGVGARIGAIATANPCLDMAVPPEQYNGGFFLFHLTDSCDYTTAAASLGRDSLVLTCAPVYMTEASRTEDEILRISDEVIVAFERSLSRDSISSIMLSRGLAIRDANPDNPNQFLCILTSFSGSNAVDKGNEMHDLPGVRWACANFIGRTVPLADPTDNYFPQQFYARQIQADSAWQVAIPAADTVKVAVIDDGISSHLDLPPSRIMPGWDVAGNVAKYKEQPDSDATPGAYCSHGMKAVGLLAASMNDTGIVGVNPWCKIVPFKIFWNDGCVFGCSNYWRARAIDSAANSGAIVSSCSWTVQPGTPTAELQEAIIRAEDTTETRHYGCVLVFGAGNTSDTVRFPANMPQVIAVGAVGSVDYRCSYSCTGAALDLVAPSDCQLDHCYAELITMDQMGSLGINPVDEDCYYDIDIPDDDYTQRFSGTSAACPQVAAVASLLLARRPGLVRISPGWGQASTADTIKTILYKSANDLGATGRDNYYGWGRVNAYRALLSIIRGDVDNNGVYDIFDVIMEIDIAFSGGQATLDDRTSDVNCDNFADVFDVIYLLGVVYSGAPLPPPCFLY
jgi:hypothetical protein